MHRRRVPVILLLLALLLGACSSADDDPDDPPTEVETGSDSVEGPAAAGPSSAVIDATAIAAGMNAIADRAEVMTVDQTATAAGVCLLLDDETLADVAVASSFMPELAQVETLIFGRDEQAMQICALPGPGGNMRVSLQRVPADDVDAFTATLADLGDGREIDRSVTAAGLPDEAVFSIDSPTATSVVNAGFLQDGILITLQANPVLDGEPADLDALLGVLGAVVASIAETVRVR